MPRDAKPVDQRQRRNLPAVLDGSATAEANSAVPAPPSELSGPLRAAWDGLWSSPVAQLLDPVSDLPAATRLWRLYQAGERLDERMASADGEEFDAAVAARVRVASECRLLESQLGLSPRSRLALGLALLAGRKQGGSLDDLADEANDG